MRSRDQATLEKQIDPVRMRLTPAARQEDAKMLTKPVAEGGKGLSRRQAAKVLGVGETTVRRDMRQNGAESAPEKRTRALLSQSDQNDWRTPRKYLEAERVLCKGMPIGFFLCRLSSRWGLAGGSKPPVGPVPTVWGVWGVCVARWLEGGSKAVGSWLEVGWKAHELSSKISAERRLDAGPVVSIRMRLAFRSRRIAASKILLLMA